MNHWLSGLVAWIESLGLHQTMQTVEWAVPAVQTVHILAIAIVFGSSLVLSLRVLRWAGTDWSPARWGKRLNGWIGWGLLALLASGVLMIVGEPARSLANLLFQIKMLLLIAAITLFVPLSRGMALLDEPGEEASASMCWLAFVLILIWLAIITCGRWIAYT